MKQEGEENGTGSEELTVAEASGVLEDLFGQDDDEQAEGGQDEAPTGAEETEDSEDAGEDAPADEDEESTTDDEDSEGDEAADDAEPKAQIFKVKVDGHEEEVPLEELIKGYSRTADYTRKTQKLAEEKRSFEQEVVAVRTERERYAHLLTKLEQTLETDLAEPDWNQLRAELAPDEFAARYAEWQIQRTELDKVKREAEAARKRHLADQARTIQETVEREFNQLKTAVPEWQDEKKLQEGLTDLLAYGQEIGFTREELESVFDHRPLLLMRKAMLYDRGVQKMKQGAKPAAKPAAAPASSPNPAKPGTPPAPRSSQKKAFQDDMRRLRSTGRAEDAAAAISKLGIF